MKLIRNMIASCVCAAVLLGVCGCGQKQIDNAEAKKDFIGQADKKFDPNDLPPNVKAGFEKWQKQGGVKTSAPAKTASGQ
jgi:hypothetical protein